MKDRILHEKVEYRLIRDMVEAIGDLYGDKVAYRFRPNPHDKESTTKSYLELRSDVRALATELLARGYKGKHIVVLGKHSYPWIVTYYATMAMGAVLVPLDKDWGALELSDTVKTADTSVIICDKDQKAKVAEICQNTGVGIGVISADDDQRGDPALFAVFPGGDELLFGLKFGTSGTDHIESAGIAVGVDDLIGQLHRLVFDQTVGSLEETEDAAVGVEALESVIDTGNDVVSAGSLSAGEDDSDIDRGKSLLLGGCLKGQSGTSEGIGEKFGNSFDITGTGGCAAFDHGHCGSAAQGNGEFRLIGGTRQLKRRDSAHFSLFFLFLLFNRLF